ncbi:MAG: CoB--CoM heterodisulfide reductase iron-sulfur subunit A family protein, partial [Thermoplasmata archaeon]
IAGIQAAIDLKNQGFDVTIVEKKPFIGGMAARIGKLPPENMDLNEILEEYYKKIDELNINVLTNAKVVNVSGFVGNFEVDISQRERGVDIGECNFCGECSKVCPVDVKYGYSAWVPPRKVIYFKYNTYPEAYTIDFDACTNCGECVKACEQNAIQLDHRENINIKLNVSTIIIAVGATLYDPVGEYGYGEYPNVVTNMDVERELSFRDVYELTINNSKLKNVVYILCVGSRDPDNPKGTPGCSRYCCQNAIKQAIRLKERGVNVWIIFRDIRTFSKGTEEMYSEASKMGVQFINSYRKDKKPKVIDDGRKVEVFDELTGETLLLDADAVVLSVGMVPNEIEVGELQKMLKIPRSGDGFFMEKHPKLGPVETNTMGIYICGCAQSPKDIADTIAQASASAAKAAIPMARGKIETEAITACVDDKLCVGCGTCEEVCEFGAPRLEENEIGVFISRINQILCKGCGVCAVTCPSRAMSMRHFRDEQISKQIEAALEEVAG